MDLRNTYNFKYLINENIATKLNNTIRYKDLKWGCITFEFYEYLFQKEFYIYLILSNGNVFNTCFYNEDKNGITITFIYSIIENAIKTNWIKCVKLNENEKIENIKQQYNLFCKIDSETCIILDFGYKLNDKESYVRCVFKEDDDESIEDDDENESIEEENNENYNSNEDIEMVIENVTKKINKIDINK